jgi:site-specific DNA recombinase
VKCGAYGANYTKSGLHRFGCAAARDRAACANHLTIRIDELEKAILAGLKQSLMEPPLFEEFVREFTAEVNRQRSIAAKERARFRTSLRG